MKFKPEYQCKKLGDSCLIFIFFDSISTENSQFILSLFRSLKSEKDFLDLVPTYCDLAIHFDPEKINAEKVIDLLDSHLKKLDVMKAVPANLHRFPVIYDGEDLERVAQLTQLDKTDIIHRHTKVQYTVAMLGFLPYFPYLIGLDPSLHLPRLETPRSKVPQGSVAIGGGQTGVYPCESPGGWNLIGRMDAEKLKSLELGDKLEFFEVQNEDQL